MSEDPVDTGVGMVAEYEQAMWDYYLPWSMIARSVIADRPLLKRLGFLNNQRLSGTGTGPANDIELNAEPRTIPRVTSTWTTRPATWAS